MHLTAYYAIKPNNDLTEKLQSLEDKNLSVALLEPTLWSHGEGGVVLWTREATIASVKLFFLAFLKMEYLSGGKYEQLLGTSQISIEVFDQWWSVERYELEGNFDSLLQRLTPSVAQSIAKTGFDGVDEWIEKLKRVDR